MNVLQRLRLRRIRSGLIDLWIRVRSSYWFIPLLLVSVAIVLSYAMILLDGRLDRDWFDKLPWQVVNQADGARSLLATVAGSMITVAGVTFSMTLLLVSHASAQIGPRLLTGFMKDRGNQLTLGVFLATFVYCLLVLRSIRTSSPSDSDLPAFVPHLSLSVGIAFALLSVFVLIYFIHHAPQKLNISNVVSDLGTELLGRLAKPYTATMDGCSARGCDTQQGAQLLRQLPLVKNVTSQQRNSYLRVLDAQGLYTLACEHDIAVEVKVQPGQFSKNGDLLLVLYGNQGFEQSLCDEVQTLFSWGVERTPEQDVRYLVDQLNEIAGRALSPGINDQLTAMACIDQFEAAMAELGQRPEPTAYWLDGEGSIRLVLTAPTTLDILTSVLVPIRQYVAGDGLTTIKLLHAIDHALGSARSEALVARLLWHARLVAEAAEECLPTGDQKSRAQEAAEQTLRRYAGTRRGTVI